MSYPGNQYRQSQQSYGYAPPSGPPPGSYGQQYVDSSSYGGNSGYVQGSGGYAPSYAPPPGPPPQHYGQQQTSFNAPPQYANMPMHAQPSQSNYGGQTTGQQPYFQYSNCTGKRKALCIGINYRGQRSELRGCVNDALNMQKFLIQNYQFKAEDMVMLLDAPGSNARQIPTRDNIIAAMQWLVRDAQPNDSLFLHYSGHGGTTKDLDGDEDDGYDETIYPLDHQATGQLVDDQLHEILVRPLPAGCRLTAIFDSCHSATVLDLPYVYSTEGKIKEPNLLADAGSTVMGAATSYLRGDLSGLASGLMGFAKTAVNGKKATEMTRQTKTSPADVISWSGCKDAQTSADTTEAGKATGAMSYAFIQALTRYPQQSYLQLLNTIRDELRGKYSQKPQLSASHPVDVNLMFII